MGEVSWLLIALATFQQSAEPLLAPFGRHYPGTQLKWRLMPDVLHMIAFEFGNPIIKLVLMESNDPAVHSPICWLPPARIKLTAVAIARRTPIRSLDVIPVQAVRPAREPGHTGRRKDLPKDL